MHFNLMRGFALAILLSCCGVAQEWEIGALGGIRVVSECDDQQSDGLGGDRLHTEVCNGRRVR